MLRLHSYKPQHLTDIPLEEALVAFRIRIVRRQGVKLLAPRQDQSFKVMRLRWTSPINKPFEIIAIFAQSYEGSLLICAPTGGFQATSNGPDMDRGHPPDEEPKHCRAYR